uniref:PR domain zinc finger protein 10 n=1 Tax=Nothobranchius korthausae TaxID=1143690 RepID=A0A1A8GA42_9TELE
METKQEPSAVWSQNSDASNPTQVHFEGGTMAQIVYSGDQADRAEQQVVYAADGNSYTSVESAEHTLVYIHPADGAQTVFADQPQVAYIQQDGTTQQVTVLLPGGQNMNAANLHVLSNVADGPQAILAPVSQDQLSASNSLTDMADITDPPTSPLGATDSTDDSDEAEDDDSEMDDWELRQPQRFDPHSLWCEECNSANSMDCPMHGPLHPIPNRPVLSKARASLPQILYIDRFLGGVFSKRRIPKRTQFGPVEAPLVPQSELQDHFFHLKLCMLDPESGGEKLSDMWLDLSDEDSCNWMMFVRPAQNHLEQNLVAYQYGSEIFYTTIKHIQPKQELKVWYAASYAEFVNQKIHSVTEEERKVLQEEEWNWPCYECNRRFVSSEQLQLHLNMHDDKLSSITRSRSRGRGRGRKRFGTGRRPGRPPKFIRLEPLADANGDKAAEMLELTEKPEEEEMEGVKNGVKEMEMEEEEEEAATGTEAESELVPPAEEQLPESITPSSPDLPGPLKEFPAPSGQSELASQNAHRAKKIRMDVQNAALQHLFIRKSFRPFKCSLCGKVFRDKDRLDQHLRVHGRDAYAFSCHICSKSFTSDSALEDHLVEHAENCTYACLLCPETFERVELLKGHVEVHSVDGCYTCPSCKKTFSDFIQVYKSASKRKAHILKNHPGAELPPSIRKLRPAAPGEPDPMLSTHTQLTGTIATAPVCCPHCAKQYSSKTKMVQHIRKKHPEFAQLANSIQTPLTTAVISSAPAVINADGATAEAVVTTDLLTQAMTELSQTLTTDFRTTQGDYQRIQYIPVSQPAGGLSQPQHIQLQVVQVAPASSPHSQAPTVDVSQLHDPHGYSQHSIQVQHIQVSEPSGSTQSTSQPLSPASQQSSQDLSPAQLTPVTLAQSHSLQASSGQQPGAVQHAYIPGNWNYRGYSSEIQMMALPHAQYVIAEASTPVSGVNSNQVKTTHFVISEGQSELDTKQDAPQDTTPARTEHLEQQSATQQATTQYIITTTTNGSGTSEVHITKP